MNKELRFLIEEIENVCKCKHDHYCYLFSDGTIIDFRNFGDIVSYILDGSSVVAKLKIKLK